MEKRRAIAIAVASTLRLSRTVRPKRMIWLVWIGLILSLSGFYRSNWTSTFSNAGQQSQTTDKKKNNNNNDDDDDDDDGDSDVILRQRLSLHPAHVITNTTVFYNIFLPNTNLADQENALRIVREQVSQLQRSYAARVLAPSKNASLVVYYVTIGESAPPPNHHHSVVLPPEQMQAYCRNTSLTKHSKRGGGVPIDCRLLEHVTHGRETITLGHLHNFCTQQQNQHQPPHSPNQERVVYLHSKGSFHAQLYNENWRPILTKLALSEYCLAPDTFLNQTHNRTTTTTTVCNVCGLNFFTSWTDFFPGNMFAATCDYVAKLIPPAQFQARLEDVAQQVLLRHVTDQIHLDLIPTNEAITHYDNFGLDRFSDEHWIASHPDVLPCDGDPTGLVLMYHIHKMKLSSMRLARAPRHRGPPLQPVDTLGKLTQTRATRREYRLREYPYLAGHLIKWFELYGQGPPPDSWAWTWFPDGAFWREQVSRYGARAVDVVTKPLADQLLLPDDDDDDVDGYHATKMVESPVVWDAGNYDKNNSVVAIFYDAFVAPELDTNRTLEANLKLITQQVKLVMESPAVQHWNATVFVSTFGHVGLVHFDPCQSTDEKKLSCNRTWRPHYPHHNKSDFGRRVKTTTLQHIYSYCQRFPTSRVTYLNNQVPTMKETDKASKTEQTRLILHLTQAALDHKCLDAVAQGHYPVKSSSCNLCGLWFSTLPFLHTPMWTTHCSYINQLLPPDLRFVSKLREAIGKALVLNVKSLMHFTLLKKRLDRLGIGGYALDQWVGSHPSLEPCHLSFDKDVTFWMSSQSASSQELRLSPVTMLGTWQTSECDRTCQAKVDPQREFYLLAGHVLKWSTLYNMTPPANSWVWTTFPNGQDWLERITKKGLGSREV